MLKSAENDVLTVQSLAKIFDNIFSDLNMTEIDLSQSGLTQALLDQKLQELDEGIEKINLSKNISSKYNLI